MKQLETWQVILIIAGVLAVIWSNIALLKYSTKFDVKVKPNKTKEQSDEKKQDEKEDGLD